MKRFFDASVFLYLSAALQQFLRAAPSLREIGDAVYPLKIDDRADASREAQVKWISSRRQGSHRETNSSIINEVNHSCLLLSAEMPDSL
jgi:hypothetical protein